MEENKTKIENLDPVTLWYVSDMIEKRVTEYKVELRDLSNKPHSLAAMELAISKLVTARAIKIDVDNLTFRRSLGS